MKRSKKAAMRQPPPTTRREAFERTAKELGTWPTSFLAGGPRSKPHPYGLISAVNGKPIARVLKDARDAMDRKLVQQIQAARAAERDGRK